MTKNTSKPQALTIVLAVLMVVWLVVCAWLLYNNSQLNQQIETLTAEKTAVEATLADTAAQLTQTQSTLSDTEQELAQTQESLTATQAELAEMTASRDAAEAQVATLTAELEKATADKEAADAALAALGYAPIQSPVVVEPAVEEPVAEEPVEEPTVEEHVTEDPAAEEPVTDEVINETPAETYEKPIVTVYTADALGVAFEGPVDWAITMDADVSDSTYVLSEDQMSDGVFTHLRVIAVKLEDAPAEEQLAAFVTNRYGLQLDQGTPVELLGAAGLGFDMTVEPEAGVTIVSRIHVAVVDGTLYAVEICAAPAYFDAAVQSVFLPACESLRLIP